MQKRWVKFGLALLGVTLVLAGCQSKPADKETLVKKPYEKSDYYLGTICTLRIYNKDKEAVLDKAFARIKKSENQATLTKSGSELDKINDNAGVKPVQVSKDMWPLMEKALHYSQESDGAFDMAIGAITDLWQIGLPGARVPAQAEIDQALSLVDYHDVVLNKAKRTVYLKKKGMRLDFGGIAKGYIADQVKQVFKENGVTSAVIDLGGNVIVMGHSPLGKNKPWTVGIQDPKKARGESVGTIKGRDISVVTAGIYEHYLKKDGHTYIYLFDRHTGYPYENNLASVTIISPKSVDGDALSNAVFNKGIVEGMQLINNKPKNIQAIMITKDNKIYLSNGLKKTFKLNQDSNYQVEKQLPTK